MILKVSSKYTKIVMLILLIGVLLYLGIYVFRSLTGSMSTTVAYQDTLDVGLDTTGVVVRDEQALSGSSGTVNVVATEGSRVAVGEEVAVVYQDSSALERQEELASLQQQLDQMTSILSTTDLEDVVAVDQQIFQSIYSLRTQAAQNELTSLESSTQTLRTLIYQQAVSSSGSSTLTDSLSQSIQSIQQQIDTLSAQTGSSTSSIKASCSGLFSQTVDGLEGVFTSSSVLSMSPSQFTAALSSSVSTEGSLGKIVTGDTWYFACVIDKDSASSFSPGNEIIVVFSGDSALEVTMTVKQVSTPEDDQVVLVLSSNLDLSQVLQMRQETVELVLERYEGIRIPQKALRIEEETTTDSETGETTVTQVPGVYTVVGVQAQFNPVEIIASGSDYYLVTPATEDSTHLLHTGDTIIVSSSGIYDGKVVIE